MRSCTVTRKLEIVKGGLADYETLARYHYRDSRLGPFAAIFAIRPAVGVIVYTMPNVGCELRNIATGDLFSGLDRSDRLSLVNKNIRCISRVVIEPRFRGLGLAVRLVRETMPQMNVGIIEAMAVMGLVNPFFEKAGMKAFKGATSQRCVRLIEAFSMVGIEKQYLCSVRKFEQRLGQLQPDETQFIEFEIRYFLMCYGKRRNMPAGSERTKFVLSKLTARPVYYIWQNPNKAICY